MIELNKNGLKPHSQMTKIMFDLASNRTLTLEEAVSTLRENARFRSIREILLRYTVLDGKNSRELNREIADRLMETNPGAKRASVEKNVRNWMKKEAQAISKENAIWLAFAFERDVSQADELMELLCGEKFHWRNPDDIVMVYGLNNQMSYQESKELQKKLRDQGIIEPAGSEPESTMSNLSRQDVLLLRTETELEAFLVRNKEKLGRFHNTAYALFRDFMTLLAIPRIEDGLGKEDLMSVREIISTYLYERYVPDARDSGGRLRKAEGNTRDAIERDIRMNWPDETVLSKMYHRQMDVSRKVLMLLFLACDGGESTYGDNSLETPEDLFQDIYTRMNDMLGDCGFARLDARRPFDWMILYCICTDESIYIEDNMQRFLTLIFQESKGIDSEQTGSEQS